MASSIRSTSSAFSRAYAQVTSSPLRRRRSWPPALSRPIQNKLVMRRGSPRFGLGRIAGRASRPLENASGRRYGKARHKMPPTGRNHLPVGWPNDARTRMTGALNVGAAMVNPGEASKNRMTEVTSGPCDGSRSVAEFWIEPRKSPVGREPMAQGAAESRQGAVLAVGAQQDLVG